MIPKARKKEVPSNSMELLMFIRRPTLLTALEDFTEDLLYLVSESLFIEDFISDCMIPSSPFYQAISRTT